MNILFLYEHPTWSLSLMQAFRARGCQITAMDMGALQWRADTRPPDCDLAINRINAMPSAERHPAVAAQTQHYLHWLEQAGVRIVNGARTHFVGCSKAVQAGLLESLGLHSPGSIAVAHGDEVLAAAEVIGYPLILKPNIGGSGSGIARYHKADELALAVRNKLIDLGVDGTGLVQENIASADGFVYRIEVLGDELFYAIRQPIQSGAFNYCAADGCSTGAADEQIIEAFTPDTDILQQVIAVVRAAGADLGGVEYLLDADNGKPCFYDFNPYSNFVAGGEGLLGFDPEQRYIDFVLGLAAT